ncbi:d7237cab-a0b5-4ec1-93e1-c442393f2142 [Sclerotinia trifoliorum]|uniref:D7237cab-a0b5-4ec1-93e1-c442393f2142 n=1 Tax=Sclerotinia trifoliorum TaxID=28548 RepID=A0A8H2ZNY5_9HELO|nr:d7237cab-a0b5-4ec1-93e1-c442393f2142 [Sclerotinia trifoliorum]
MISYLHPETLYEVSSISTRSPIHINIDFRLSQNPTQTFNSMTTMLSKILYLPLETLTHALIQLVAIILFLALIIVTYLLYTIRFISNLTGLTFILYYLWNRFPTIIKRKAAIVYEERRELRRQNAEARTERLRERNEVGEREKAQIRDAMRRVAWKRGVGKMDYGTDLAEDAKKYKSGAESKLKDGDENSTNPKRKEIEEWIEDEVFIQNPQELQQELEKLENRADYGKKAGYWDEEEQMRAREAAKILLRNGEVEAFPRFEDMDTRM